MEMSGVSRRFVGVYRCYNKRVAEIVHRGKYYYLGTFEDEVEAAKARDRKACELNREYAYITLPEELARRLRQRRRHGLAPPQFKVTARPKRKALARAGGRRPGESRRKRG